MCGKLPAKSFIFFMRVHFLKHVFVQIKTEPRVLERWTRTALARWTKTWLIKKFLISYPYMHIDETEANSPNSEKMLCSQILQKQTLFKQNSDSKSENMYNRKFSMAQMHTVYPIRY